MLVRFTPRHVPRLDRWSTNSRQLALAIPSERAMSPLANTPQTASSPRHAISSITFVV
jgi:hypothetical protein